MGLIGSALPFLLGIVLAWFSISRAVRLLVGLRSLWIGWTWRHAATDSMMADASLHDAHRPISILVPAAGARAEAVIETLRSLSDLARREVEVIVAIDLQDRALLSSLVVGWDLEEAPTRASSRIPASIQWSLLRSRRGGRLLVARTDPQSALPVALGLARLPIVCAVSPGTTVDEKALLRAALLFSGEEHVVAIAGGALPFPSAAMGLRARLQHVAFLRDFFAGGAGRCAFRARLGEGAPFHLLHRESLLRAGGYDGAAVDPHLDALMRMSRHLRSEDLPFRTLVALEPVGRVPLPEDFGAHRRKTRAGLADALWRQRGALLRPRLGVREFIHVLSRAGGEPTKAEPCACSARESIGSASRGAIDSQALRGLGLVSLPWLWCFERFAPIVEAAGLALVVAAVGTGALAWDLAALGVGAAAAHGLLRTTIALGARRLLERTGASEDRPTAMEPTGAAESS
ncbi:MAG TPA: hypothetical protein VGD74_10310 [Vulgatibacter sp.]